MWGNIQQNSIWNCSQCKKTLVSLSLSKSSSLSDIMCVSHSLLWPGSAYISLTNRCFLYHWYHLSRVHSIQTFSPKQQHYDTILICINRKMLLAILYVLECPCVIQNTFIKKREKYINVQKNVQRQQQDLNPGHNLLSPVHWPLVYAVHYDLTL